MNYKYVVGAAIALSVIVAPNFFLWQKDAEDRETKNDKENVVNRGFINKSKQNEISEEFEYPAPVKQLQQVLVKSYQPPAHNGEEIFPDELLSVDGNASANSEANKQIEELRKRIESIKLTPEGGS